MNYKTGVTEMKKYYETDKFRKLQTEWNRKLRKSGYQGETEQVKTESLVRPQEFNNQRRDAHFGFDYYQFCQQILREYRFFSEEVYSIIEEFKLDGQEEQFIDGWLRENCVRDYTNYLVFQLHTEGLSERKIHFSLVEMDWPKKIRRPRINQIIREIKDNFLRMKK